MVTFSKINSLENNINNRFQQSDSVANGLSNEISSIYSNVETKLKKQGSILDKYNITFGELNPSNFTIPVTLTLMVQDKYGLNYKYVIDVYEDNNNKQPFNYSSEREKRRLVEITDRNGKKVYVPKYDIVK